MYLGLEIASARLWQREVLVCSASRPAEPKPFVCVRAAVVRRSGETVSERIEDVASRNTSRALRLMDVEIVSFEDDDLAVKVEVERAPVGVRRERDVAMEADGNARRGDFVRERHERPELRVVREEHLFARSESFGGGLGGKHAGLVAEIRESAVDQLGVQHAQLEVVVAGVAVGVDVGVDVRPGGADRDRIGKAAVVRRGDGVGLRRRVGREVERVDAVRVGRGRRRRLAVAGRRHGDAGNDAARTVEHASARDGRVTRRVRGDVADDPSNCIVHRLHLAVDVAVEQRRVVPHVALAAAPSHVEVDVQRVAGVAVAVRHDRMARFAAPLLDGDDARRLRVEAGEQGFVDDVALHKDRVGVVERVDERVWDVRDGGAATIRTILHIHRDARVVAELAHRLAPGFGGVGAPSVVAVDVLGHVVPVVRAAHQGEEHVVAVRHALEGGDGDGIVRLRPLEVAHDLRGGRGHASARIIGGGVVVEADGVVGSAAVADPGLRPVVQRRERGHAQVRRGGRDGLLRVVRVEGKRLRGGAEGGPARGVAGGGGGCRSDGVGKAGGGLGFRTHGGVAGDEAPQRVFVRRSELAGLRPGEDRGEVRVAGRDHVSAALERHHVEYALAVPPLVRGR